MKKNEVREIPEIVIPKDYELEDFLEMDDGNFGEEEPIFTEEVKIRFER